MDSFFRSKASILLIVTTTLGSFACQTQRTVSNAPERASASTSDPGATDERTAAPRAPKSIDVLKLADKNIAELDAFLGRTDETKSIENGGQYRLYKVNGHSRGLAVRVYRNRAKEFNLILDRPIPTAREALKTVFNIDVGDAKPVKDGNEPLSESYRGTFGGIRFTKVSAKKSETGNGFIFVLAQVAK